MTQVVTMLQWGRDLTVAERYAFFTFRLEGRHASMGPRPDGRGESRQFRGIWVKSPSFNGAAT